MKVVTPRIGLMVAAVANLVGAFLGEEIADTSGKPTSRSTPLATCSRSQWRYHVAPLVAFPAAAACAGLFYALARALGMP